MGFIMTFSCMWFDHVQPLHLLSSSHWSPSSYWSSCFHDPVSSIRIAYETWGRGYLHKHRLRGSGTKENVSASLTTTSCLYKSSGRHETLRPPTLWQDVGRSNRMQRWGLMNSQLLWSHQECSIYLTPRRQHSTTLHPSSNCYILSTCCFRDVLQIKEWVTWISYVYMLQEENCHP